jgi:NADPH:quinone reductase-like Zn-dependent oxidoreductase
MTTMKAAVIHQYGGPDVLKYEDAPDPSPGDGEVLIKVAAAGLNPVDQHEHTGATKDWRPLAFPAVIGWDVSGTVIRLGKDVAGLALGDRVCAWAYHTFAELCAAKAELFAAVPAAMDLIDAAAYPLSTTTGAQLVANASGIQPGNTVIVSGAAGAVGRTAVYMAKKLGASHVIAGVRSDQLSQAGSIGAHETVALDDANAVAALPSVDIVANAVGGQTAEMLLTKVHDGGTFASVTGPPGNAGQYPAVNVKAFVSKQDAKLLRALLDAIATGELHIPIERRTPLRDAAAAEAAFERGSAGKVLLIP